MTRCQTCNRSFEDGAYAIQPRASDRKLECIECCMKREDRARARACQAANRRRNTLGEGEESGMTERETSFTLVLRCSACAGHLGIGLSGERDGSEEEEFKGLPCLLCGDPEGWLKVVSVMSQDEYRTWQEGKTRDWRIIS